MPVFVTLPVLGVWIEIRVWPVLWILQLSFLAWGEWVEISWCNVLATAK
jgi:hypothetical protein